MMKNLLLALACSATFATADAQSLTKAAPQEGILQTESSINPKYILKNGEYFLSYCPEYSQLNGLGTGQPCQIGAAIKINKELAQAIKGHKIHTLRVSMFSVKGLTNAKVWIRKNLNDTKNITEQAHAFNKGSAKSWMDITLDKPYIADGEEFYIGYSVNSTSSVQTQSRPVGFSTDTDHPDGIYLQLNGGAWTNYYGQGFGALAIMAVGEGKTLENNLAINNIKSDYFARGQEGAVEINITNLGKQPISTVDVEYTMNGATQKLEGVKATTNKNKPIGTFGSGTCTLNITAPNEGNKTDLNLKITKINGNADEDMSNNEASLSIPLLSKFGQHKVVVEEYTGSRCGYCVRGAAGMERLARDLKDKSVCIAAHSGDNMAIQGYAAIQQYVQGAPQAVVDREITCDPYFGQDNTVFGIGNLVKERAAKIVPFDVFIDVADGSNATTKNITANLLFYGDMGKCDYKVAFVLLEDGLIGSQFNYYAGTAGQPEDLAKYSSMPSKIKDFVFDDVARDISAFGGINYWTGQEILANQPLTYTYRMNVSNAKNIDNCGVAVLVFNKDGVIVNANEITFKEAATGIEDATNNGFAPRFRTNNGVLTVSGEGNMALEVYSASGARMAAQQFNGETSVQLGKGVYVVRVTANGKSVTKKLVL